MASISRGPSIQRGARPPRIVTAASAAAAASAAVKTRLQRGAPPWTAMRAPQARRAKAKKAASRRRLNPPSSNQTRDGWTTRPAFPKGSAGNPLLLSLWFPNPIVALRPWPRGVTPCSEAASLQKAAKDAGRTPRPREDSSARRSHSSSPCSPTHRRVEAALTPGPRVSCAVRELERAFIVEGSRPTASKKKGDTVARRG